MASRQGALNYAGDFSTLFDFDGTPTAGVVGWNKGCSAGSTCSVAAVTSPALNGNSMQMSATLASSGWAVWEYYYGLTTPHDWSDWSGVRLPVSQSAGTNMVFELNESSRNPSGQAGERFSRTLSGASTLSSPRDIRFSQLAPSGFQPGVDLNQGLDLDRIATVRFALSGAQTTTVHVDAIQLFHQTSAIIPFYTHPYDGPRGNANASTPLGTAWTHLVTAANLHPGIDVLMVINPDNGPNATPDTIHDYGYALPKLRSENSARNIRVLGYVRTAFAHQPSYLGDVYWPPEYVCRDLDHWGGQTGNANASTCADTWPGYFPSATAPGFRLDGIFFDEYASDSVNAATPYTNPDQSTMTRGQFYTAARDHARARGWSLLIGNSGGMTSDIGFLNYVSGVIIYENSGWPSSSQLNLPASRGKLGILPYGVASAPTVAQVADVASKVKYIGAIASSSWSNDSGQAYFETLFAGIEQNP